MKANKKRVSKVEKKGKMSISEYFKRFKTHDTKKGIVILDTKTGKKRYISDAFVTKKKI